MCVLHCIIKPAMPKNIISKQHFEQLLKYIYKRFLRWKWTHSQRYMPKRCYDDKIPFVVLHKSLKRKILYGILLSIAEIKSRLRQGHFAKHVKWVRIKSCPFSVKKSTRNYVRGFKHLCTTWSKLLPTNNNNNNNNDFMHTHGTCSVHCIYLHHAPLPVMLTLSCLVSQPAVLMPLCSHGHWFNSSTVSQYVL